MPSSVPTQFVLIDDTDPRIQYQGTWVPEVQGFTERPDWGIYGSPHNRTLTRITSDGTFIFKYNGTTIEMEGSTDTSYGRPKPTWKCSIDNELTINTSEAPDNTRTNRWLICDSNNNNMRFGEHTFRFEVTVPAGGAFWFDQLKYNANEPTLADETMYISDDDSSVTYSPANNFNLSGDTSHLTDIPGSSVTLKFTGTSASLFVTYEQNLPPSKGSYSIDGQPPVPFDILGIQGSNALFNQEVFHTPDLPPTEHILITTFAGRPKDTPLNVDYFYVTLPSSLNTTGGEGADDPTHTQAPNVKHSTPDGAIIGGVVGGVALLAFAIVVVFFLWKCQRRRKLSQREDELTIPTPFVEIKDHIGGPPADPYTSSTQAGPSPQAPAAVRTWRQVPSYFSRREREAEAIHSGSGVRLGNLDTTSRYGSTIAHDPPPQYTEGWLRY